MRAFLLLCAVILGCLAAGCLLGYPAYLVVHPINPEWPFHRIANRVALLLLLISLIWLLKYLRVSSRQGLGYTLGWHSFVRQMLTALGVGVLVMLPVMGVLYALGIRVLSPDLAFTPAVLGPLLLKGLISGLVVAFIEETLLRGAMHSAIERESGTRMAVVLTALIYAALHFLNRTKIPHAEVDWMSGFELLRGILSGFAHPLALVDSFLALFAVGVLLGLVRVRTGSIAACIGLHAGWVWVISVTRDLTTANPAASWSFLVGSYDGVVGYLVLAWTLVSIAVFWRLSRPAGAAQLQNRC